jgi:hypothetical protein
VKFGENSFEASEASEASEALVFAFLNHSAYHRAQITIALKFLDEKGCDTEFFNLFTYSAEIFKNKFGGLTISVKKDYFMKKYAENLKSRVVIWTLCLSISLGFWLLFSHCGFFFHRVVLKRKVENVTLGIPTGSVRSFIAITLISFPFYFLLKEIPSYIPSAITSLIFVIVTYYFEMRSEGYWELIQKLKNLQEKNPQKNYHPLYLPKYTVRITLVSLLISMFLYNASGPQVSIEWSNVLFDIIIIVVFFWIGMFLGKSEERKLENSIKLKLVKFPNLENKDARIFKELKKEQQEHPNEGHDYISIFMITAILASLVLYTSQADDIFSFLGLAEIRWRQILLFLLNIYYGYRQ